MVSERNSSTEWTGFFVGAVVVPVGVVVYAVANGQSVSPIGLLPCGLLIYGMIGFWIGRLIDWIRKDGE